MCLAALRAVVANGMRRSWFANFLGDSLHFLKILRYNSVVILAPPLRVGEVSGSQSCVMSLHVIHLTQFQVNVACCPCTTWALFRTQGHPDLLKDLVVL